jgi:hypothetical protein
MARGPNKFKQRDVTRALRGARAAGIEARLEIEPNGKMILIPVGGTQPVPVDDLDRESADFERRHGQS